MFEQILAVGDFQGQGHTKASGAYRKNSSFCDSSLQGNERLGTRGQETPGNFLSDSSLWDSVF